MFTPDELSRIREDGVYRAQHDWAFLTRYQAENAALKPPAPGENRVVFMGNSITEFSGKYSIRLSSKEGPSSTGASAGRPLPRCCCASGRM
ncbi:MAG: hypothetical protein U0T82_07865 [Bacteroidales bacterium]